MDYFHFDHIFHLEKFLSLKQSPMHNTSTIINFNSETLHTHQGIRQAFAYLDSQDTRKSTRKHAKL